jgi:2-methylcitrate dehydratase PrpD
MSELNILTDDFVRKPEVQALMGRVTFETTPEMMAGLSFAPFDAVAIRTVSGETLESGPVERAKGSHQKPLSEQELWTKFADCMGGELSAPATSRAFEHVNSATHLVRPDRI